MSRRALSSLLSASRVLTPLSVTVALSLCVVSGLMVLHMRQGAWDQVARTSQNLLEVTERAIDRNIELYDLSLQAVVEGIQNPDAEGLSPAQRQLVLFDRSATAKGLGAILVADAQGDVFVDSASAVPRRLNFTEREFFRVHKEHHHVGLYVGEPIISRTNGRLIIPFSRRLAYADGTFAGVVVGAMDVSYINDLLRRLSVGQGSSVALFRTDGVMLARNPSNEQAAGKNIAGSAHFHHYLENYSGQFTATAKIDGVERLYTYSRIGTLPLVVNVNIATDVIAALWRTKALAISASVLLLCAGMVGVTLLLQRELARRVRAEQATRAANDELAQLAVTDALTGLPNRRHFDATLAHAWGEAERTGTPLALLLVDADHFKRYNDTYGHPAGDEVLRALARCLRRQVSGADEVACRIGGEEFGVILRGTSGREAVFRAEHIRASVAQLKLPHRGHDGGIVTVSVGVAHAFHEGVTTLHACYAAADAALYAAKRSGRNRVVPRPDMRIVTLGQAGVA